MVNPEVLNLICPQCSKAWLLKGDGHYHCPACSYVMIERVAKEYAVSLVVAATEGMSTAADHKAIYLITHMPDQRNIG